jgi:putative nucleotidyltransferase with HDIG domain
MIENTIFINSLIENQIISKEILDFLLMQNNQDAFAVLLELSKNKTVNKQKLGELWGDSINTAYVDLDKTIINIDVLNEIPEEFARKNNTVALYKFANVITVAVSNPKNIILLDKIEKITQIKVSPLFAFPDSIDNIINKNYKTNESLSNLTQKLASLKSIKLQSNQNKVEEDSTKSVISERVKKYWMENTKSILNDASEGKIPSIKDCNDLKNSIIEEVHNKIDMVKCINQLRINDEYTYSHSVNTAALCAAIAKEFSFSEQQIKDITLGALLHDLGKMRVPKVILYKPDKLSPEEMEIIKRHPDLGYKMVVQMDVPKIVAEVALHHHERANGQGYPRQLLLNQVSVYDQIMAIVDVYDALISDRPYKTAIPFHNAINLLFLEGQTVFNNDFLYKFVEIVYKKNTQSINQDFKSVFFK